MNRRSFFTALVGAGAGSAAKASAKPPARGLGLPAVPSCVCGLTLVTVSTWDDATDVGRLDCGIDVDGEPNAAYLTCPNLKCPQHGKKYAKPTIQLKPAPPELVERVDRGIEQERRREREWRQRHACLYANGQLVTRLEDDAHRLWTPLRYPMGPV